MSDSWAAWSEILPDDALASMAEAERIGRAEQEQADSEAADKAVAAENTAWLKQITGHKPRTVAEVFASRQGELADRVPKSMREPLDVVIDVAPVRRARVHRDGLDTITRAVAAAEARRLDRPALEAAEALEASRANRGPEAAEWAGAWVTWRRR